ncbi:MAG TPA: metallophosphoesterase [Verrucomicrobiae bacterium]|nr:metallophosphoesterase [Verrucomicrobiae bacterium]
MKFPRLSRRKFIASAVGAAVLAPLAVVAEAKLAEPTWLKIRRVRIGSGTASHRLVHFTDIHHKGDRAYLETVVKTINSLSPDFVCFTGDIIEEFRFLKEALELMAGIKSPMFGVPGNHDYWSSINFEPVHQCFAATGGAWLIDEQRRIANGKINLIGATCIHASQALVTADPAAKNILLMHYPAWVKKLGDQKFDLMLAGHSHGGQVRIPFYGPVMVPFGVDEYDLGLYQTKAGPLYVNAGIGYIYNYNFRFNCRPEITVIEV